MTRRLAAVRDVALTGAAVALTALVLEELADTIAYRCRPRPAWPLVGPAAALDDDENGDDE